MLGNYSFFAFYIFPSDIFDCFISGNIFTLKSQKVVYTLDSDLAIKSRPAFLIDHVNQKLIIL